MSTPKEQYDAMLDELPPDEQMRLIGHVAFARILEDVDPVAYRCGLNDMQTACDECGREYWANDPDAEALCDDCAADHCEVCGEVYTDGDADEDRCADCRGKE